MDFEITLGPVSIDAIEHHLNPAFGEREEAGFLFAQPSVVGSRIVLGVLEWYPVAHEGFVIHSAYHLELADQTRSSLFKRAHELGASLIETHSHPGQERACFSWSDLQGFEAFVPQALWRLGGRPYAALVFGQGSFDALVWSEPGASPRELASIHTHKGLMRPTGLTIKNWSHIQ